ncbi:Ankyrin repeat-containing domain protein [Lactarius tabidus]
MTALCFASCYGHLGIAELLLEHGANVDVRNSYGRTPRQEALAYGHSRIAEVLLGYRARET